MAIEVEGQQDRKDGAQDGDGEEGDPEGPIVFRKAGGGTCAGITTRGALMAHKCILVDGADIVLVFLLR